MKRSDANQAKIVAALRGVGAMVQDLHGVGHGCPDLLVGYRGQLCLMEVKSEHGKLTIEEMVWHEHWMHFPVYVVRSEADVFEAIGLIVEAQGAR